MAIRFLAVQYAIFTILSVSLFAQSPVPDSLELPPLLQRLGVGPAGPDQTDDSLVTFVSAVNRVMGANPLIDALRADIRAAAGRLQQSRARLNPELTAEVEDFGHGSGGGPGQTTLGIEQTFELWGKPKARGESAQSELAAQQREAQRILLELYRQTAASFSALLAAQENLANARKRLDLAIRVQEAVRIKLNDGAVPASELLRAKSSTKLAEIEVSHAEAEQARSQIALAVLWGGIPRAIQADGRLDWWMIDIAADTLLDLVNSHPEIRSLESQLEARRAEVRLARSVGKPDITLGGGIRRLHDNKNNAFLLWASLPLPIFNRNKGGVAGASAQVKRLEAEVTAKKQQLGAELQQRILQLKAQQAEVAAIRGGVLPPAEEALQAIDEAFRLGSQPYLNVLDAQRTLAEIEFRLVEVLVAGAQTASEIESLIGRSLTAAGR